MPNQYFIWFQLKWEHLKYNIYGLEDRWYMCVLNLDLDCWIYWRPILAPGPQHHAFILELIWSHTVYLLTSIERMNSKANALNFELANQPVTLRSHLSTKALTKLHGLCEVVCVCENAWVDDTVWVVVELCMQRPVGWWQLPVSKYIRLQLVSGATTPGCCVCTTALHTLFSDSAPASSRPGLQIKRAILNCLHLKMTLINLIIEYCAFLNLFIGLSWFSKFSLVYISIKVRLVKISTK